MDLTYSDAEQAFRAEAREWLEANVPRDLASGDTAEGFAQHLEWEKKLYEARWAVVSWPEAYGGREASLWEWLIFEEEYYRAGAPQRVTQNGIFLLAPTLFDFGTQEQQDRILPRMAAAEDLWCQGWSEPGAGSDLAALQTRAEDKGDHFLINGQKIWTSGAQFADWCFCLVRTDTTKKHEGISFVLIDMHQPGVEVRPIKLIAGNSPFCETFFTDAVALKKNLVGPLNGGWTIGKRLLQHERSGLSGGGGSPFGGAAKGPPDLAKDYVGVDEKGRIADTDLRSRIIQNEIDLKAFQLTAMRAMAEAKGNASPSAATSIMKNAATSTLQQRAELTLEIMGAQGLGWEGEGFSKDELAAVRGWLGGKATTIYGGSQEIQSNIISKRILGLPDLTQSK